jgi:hypothetical protein
VSGIIGGPRGGSVEISRALAIVVVHRVSSMDAIEFSGVVVDGTGQYKELGVPGKSQLKTAPDDWPAVLYRGSLNIRVAAWPAEFEHNGLEPSVEILDTGRFAPEFEINRDQFEKNLLHPRDGVPRGGDAQVWRAHVMIARRVMSEPPCWVLRRFGSRVEEQLELVSAVRLRHAYGLGNGTEVVVRMFGTWRTT